MKIYFAGFALLFSVSAEANQLLTNGTFETGSLSGWTVSTETGGTPGSGFFADKLTTAPVSGDTVKGAASGTWFAVSDDNGPASIVLSQSFTVTKGSSVSLSFSMFVDSNATGSVNTTNGLDFNAINSQYGIVSLLSAGTSLFSTGAGDLKNFYTGVDAVGANDPYQNYSFDISSLVSAGGTYTLRFGAVNNVDQLNLGVDNVSIVSTATPEPGSLVLGLIGAVLLWKYGVRARRRSPATMRENGFGECDRSGIGRSGGLPRRHKCAGFGVAP